MLLMPFRNTPGKPIWSFLMKSWNKRVNRLNLWNCYSKKWCNKAREIIIKIHRGTAPMNKFKKFVIEDLYLYFVCLFEFRALPEIEFKSCIEQIYKACFDIFHDEYLDTLLNLRLSNSPIQSYSYIASFWKMRRKRVKRKSYYFRTD